MTLLELLGVLFLALLCILLLFLFSKESRSEKAVVTLSSKDALGCVIDCGEIIVDTKNYHTEAKSLIHERFGNGGKKYHINYEFKKYVEDEA